jgi:hypothetical protein
VTAPEIGTADLRRIEMKKMSVALLVVAAGAASANADLRQNATALTMMSGQARADRGTAVGTGFEAAEGYAIGNIAGQNFWSDNSTGTAPRGSMTIAGPAQGNGSDQALRLSVGPQNQGQFGQAFSPALPAGSNGMSVDVRMNDNGGGNYGVAGFLSTNAASPVAFRVEFDYRGNIFHVVGSTFTSTGISWAQNLYRTLTLDITPAGINANYGGTPFLIPLSTGGNLSFDSLTFYHDNFQAFGAGAFPGSTGPAAAYFDNLSIVPAPASVALLGLGGLVAARRRRA